MSYDSDNIFAKILRGEIPCKTVFENDHVLAFEDIDPKAPTHVLIIPKAPYISLDDLSKNAKDEEIIHLMRGVSEVTSKLGLDEKGYRLITNIGEHGCQEVPHLHFHILSGEKIGSLRS